MTSRFHVRDKGRKEEILRRKNNRCVASKPGFNLKKELDK